MRNLIRGNIFEPSRRPINEQTERQSYSNFQESSYETFVWLPWITWMPWRLKRFQFTQLWSVILFNHERMVSCVIIIVIKLKLTTENSSQSFRCRLMFEQREAWGMREAGRCRERVALCLLTRWDVVKLVLFKMILIFKTINSFQLTFHWRRYN